MGLTDRAKRESLQSLFAPLQAAQPVYRLKLVTDRENAVYQTGEEARFVVAVTRDGQPLASGAVS